MAHDVSSSFDEDFIREITQSQTALRSYIRKLVGDRVQCDDILQETNLVIFKKRMDWDPTTVFLKWAYRVAYFQTKAHFRDQARANKRLVFSEQVMETLAEESPVFETDGELRAALDCCLGKIETKKRQLLLSRYDQNTSLESLAVKEGCTPNALSQLLRRLRATLSRCIRAQMNSLPSHP